MKEHLCHSEREASEQEHKVVNGLGQEAEDVSLCYFFMALISNSAGKRTKSSSTKRAVSK